MKITEAAGRNIRYVIKGIFDCNGKRKTFYYNKVIDNWSEYLVNPDPTQLANATQFKNVPKDETLEAAKEAANNRKRCVVRFDDPEYELVEIIILELKKNRYGFSRISQKSWYGRKRESLSENTDRKLSESAEKFRFILETNTGDYEWDNYPLEDTFDGTWEELEDYLETTFSSEDREKLLNGGYIIYDEDESVRIDDRIDFKKAKFVIKGIFKCNGEEKTFYYSKPLNNWSERLTNPDIESIGRAMYSFPGHPTYFKNIPNDRILQAALEAANDRENCAVSSIDPDYELLDIAIIEALPDSFGFEITGSKSWLKGKHGGLSENTTNILTSKIFDKFLSLGEK